jgi:hypothetical protein
MIPVNQIDNERRAHGDASVRRGREDDREGYQVAEDG